MNIGNVLSDDDAVDELTADQVKDVWVRGNFYHAINRAHGSGSRWMLTDDAEDVEQLLAEGSNSAIMQAAIIGLGREHAVTQSLGWEDGPGNVETLWDRLTKDDTSIDAARRSIKSALRGCGMPRINIMRDRVRVHTGEDPGNTYDPASEFDTPSEGQASLGDFV